MWIHRNDAKKKIIIIVHTIVFGLCMFAAAIAQDCKPSKYQIEDGETLSYRLYYNWGILWVPAGEAVFTLREDGSLYHAEVVGRSSSTYSRIFNVNNIYRSTFDKSDFRPHRFVRYVEENKYRRFDSLVFDRNAGLVKKLQGKDKVSATWTEDEVDVCTFDLVSVLYYLRTIDIKKKKSGDKVAVGMYLDDKRYPVQMIFGDRKLKNVRGLGKFKAIEVRPTVIAGHVFGKDTDMIVWVSDDRRKIPLIVESPLRVGSIKAILTDFTM